MEKVGSHCKHRNSTVYLAKNGSSSTQNLGIFETRCDSCDVRLPAEQDTVSQIKVVFENASVTPKLRERCHGNIEKGEKFQGSQTSSNHLQTADVLRFSSQDMSAVEDQVSASQEPREKMAGTLLLQPASNVRSPLMRAEYLNLSKFNDIKTFTHSNKRPKMSVDELDKRMEQNLPVQSCEEDLVDSSSLIENELEPLQELNTQMAYEFEGAGVKVKRPVLKITTSRDKKLKVSFSTCPSRVFEYPPECTLVQTLEELPSEPCDSDFWNDDLDCSDVVRKSAPGKSLQSTPTYGKLATYQSRILEPLSHYGLEAPLVPSCALQQQPQRTHSSNLLLLQMENAMGNSSYFSDEHERPWSEKHLSNELLF